MSEKHAPQRTHDERSFFDVFSVIIHSDCRNVSRTCQLNLNVESDVRRLANIYPSDVVLAIQGMLKILWT